MATSPCSKLLPYARKLLQSQQLTCPGRNALEHESHPHHHPHGTGYRWLDITLGVSATIVSLVSLGLALHSGHAMEKLVAANSYPYLEQWRSNMSDKPVPRTDRFRGKVEQAV